MDILQSDQLHIVRYENLKENLGLEMEKLMNFLNLEFDKNFASENHGRNSKKSAFQPRSESSLTSGRIYFLIFKQKSWFEDYCIKF